MCRKKEGELDRRLIPDKRIYNIERNANLVCLGALLDMETYNNIQKIKEKRGMNNIEYVRECYRLVKEEYSNEKEWLQEEGLN